MTERELVASAALLPSVTRGAALAFASAGDALAAAVSARMLTMEGIEELVGPGNVRMMMDTHHRQARFMASILSEFDPSLFVRTVLWAIDSHRAFGFQDEYWRRQLETLRTVMPSVLDQQALDAVEPVFTWLGDHLESFLALGGARYLQAPSAGQA